MERVSLDILVIWRLACVKLRTRLWHMVRLPRGETRNLSRIKFIDSV